MNRRLFLGLSAGAALTPKSFAGAAPVNKRERMLRWLAGQTTPNYTPAAFFLHFGNGYRNGSAAAKRHLEFFQYTDMDFLKIQFEQTYTRQDVRACIKEGVDGFYASTQGGEAQRFGNSSVFNNYIKPFDVVSMREI